MAVGPQDKLARQHQGLFAQHLVTDPTPHFEEMSNALFLYEVAHFSVILRMAGGWGRHGMVQSDAHALGDGDLLQPDRAKNAGNGSRIIVGERHIRVGGHYLAGDSV